MNQVKIWRVIWTQKVKKNKNKKKKNEKKKKKKKKKKKERKKENVIESVFYLLLLFGEWKKRLIKKFSTFIIIEFCSLEVVDQILDTVTTLYT